MDEELGKYVGQAARGQAPLQRAAPLRHAPSAQASRTRGPAPPGQLTSRPWSGARSACRRLPARRGRFGAPGPQTLGPRAWARGLGEGCQVGRREGGGSKYVGGWVRRWAGEQLGFSQKPQNGSHKTTQHMRGKGCQAQQMRAAQPRGCRTTTPHAPMSSCTTSGSGV